MSRREELEREIRELENIIEHLNADVYHHQGNVEHYQALLDTKNKEFRDEYYAAENDFVQDTAMGASSTDIVNEGYELRYKLQLIQAQYDDEARNIISNLNEAKRELGRKEFNLRQAKSKLREYQNELHNLPQSSHQEYHHEEYDENSPNIQHQQQYEENIETESYDYKPTEYPSVKPKTKQSSSNMPPINKNDEYRIHRVGLIEYAKISKKNYKELKAVTGGYRAAVGDTIFDYRNPDDLVVTSSKGVPSIGDFKAIFQIEKKIGRKSLPISEMSNKEYMARLITGAFEAGLTPRGQFRLQEKDLQKLNPETRKKYQDQIQIYDIKLLKQREKIKKSLGK